MNKMKLRQRIGKQSHGTLVYSMMNVSAEDEAHLRNELKKLSSNAKFNGKFSNLFVHESGASLKGVTEKLKHRQILDLSHMVCTAIHEWARDNRVECVRASDVETVFKVIQLLGTRRDGD
ncbi:hypothetical protein Q3V30_20785 [Erwinia pyri]|uniref:Uncharacterized protein n=1 Tax=Erwinia pyri TaxID=3062598 RepID=A0AA50DMI8_9GAMM|nr:hypothetical protein [Erwinia sp. DE2]WLS78826.1 hypothetical protein Q3V30_20785 [Erwinia sp. DE2]